MKKNHWIVWLLLAAMLLTILTGCNRQTQAEEPEQTQKPEAPAEETEQPQPPVTAAPDPTSTPELTPDPTPEQTPETKTYTDNFSVSTEDAAAYARQVQQVVRDKDLDTLTGMIAFPIYMMASGGGQSITSAEDFKALGAEAIFTDEFVTEIISADVDHLSPSRAGFSVSTTGRPNLVFSVVNGELHIVSLNY